MRLYPSPDRKLLAELLQREFFCGILRATRLVHGCSQLCALWKILALCTSKLWAKASVLYRQNAVILSLYITSPLQGILLLMYRQAMCYSWGCALHGSLRVLCASYISYFPSLHLHYTISTDLAIRDILLYKLKSYWRVEAERPEIIRICYKYKLKFCIAQQLCDASWDILHSVTSFTSIQVFLPLMNLARFL